MTPLASKNALGSMEKMIKNKRGAYLISELLEPLNLCNPVSFFIKESYTTWRKEISRMKENTNRDHTLDYFFTPFCDLRKHIRNCETSIRLSCHSTDLIAVTLTYTLTSDKTLTNLIQTRDKL